MVSGLMMADFSSAPIMILSFAYSKAAMPMAFRPSLEAWRGGGGGGDAVGEREERKGGGGVSERGGGVGERIGVETYGLLVLYAATHPYVG